MARAIHIEINGQRFDQWQSAVVSRDINDFAGTFSFQFRDTIRNIKTLPYASLNMPFMQIKAGLSAKIYIHSELVLDGYIETVSPEINEMSASITIDGRDKAGDLVDCTALPNGPLEFVNLKLEDIAKKIAAAFGITVRAEVDTGAIFERFGVDLTETGLSALEKGARQRQCLLLSDGVGGLLITRSGASRAPTSLTLPGNVISSSGTLSFQNRFSDHIVRGQSEKAAGGRKDAKASLTSGGTPATPEDRQASNNSSNGNASKLEQKGTSATGMAKDDEVLRYRPKVYLARTKANKDDCQSEADWRMRSSRGQAEEMRYSVHGFRANFTLWRINQLVFVQDSFQDICRDMLISRVEFREDDGGRKTELTITSPEAYDDEPVQKRRENQQSKSQASQTLDGTAEGL